VGDDDGVGTRNSSVCVEREMTDVESSVGGGGGGGSCAAVTFGV
jgi:hypothetical protein